MRNPLKRYYFMAGTTVLKIFDCTTDIWFWQNPQDAVTDVLEMWRKEYGDNVSITEVTRI